MRWLAVVFVSWLGLGCTRTNPDALDLCVPQGACGNGTYSLCSRDGCPTRYTASTASFQCLSCANCQSALSQVLFFCAGGGGDASCTTLATGSECINCCVSHHSTGYDQYLTLLANCECVNPGACKTDCQASFCADHTQSDTFCDLCLNGNSGSGGICDITPACSFNADCTALLTCARACPP